MTLRFHILIALFATSVALTAQTVSPPLFNAFEYDDDGDLIVDEFDDFPADATIAFQTHDPSRSQLGRAAFEIDWPRRGDDDFNDLVLSYHFAENTDGTNQVVELQATVTVVAIGTETSVGAALRVSLPKGTVVKATLARDGGVPTSISSEPNTSDTIYRLFDDALLTRDAVPFANTLTGDPWINGERIELRIVLSEPISSSVFDLASPFDLFVFHTAEPGREIHQPAALPTSLADLDFIGTFSDATDLTTGRTYLSDAGLPWAIDIPEAWSHPTEGTDLATAYPDIVDWIESGGSAKRDWYRHPEENEVRP